MLDSSKRSETRVRAEQAKDFLISQIIEEAHRQSVPLSDVERTMLYFTESQETLPDIHEVNEQFENEYDDADYEKKIASLLRNAYQRIRKESPEGERRWKQAIAALRKEDHYLLVMLDQSLQPASDFWTVVAWATGIIICLFVMLALWDYLNQKGWVPGWVANIPLRLAIFAGIVVWAVVALAKKRVLGEVVKSLCKGVLSMFPFSLFRKRSRE
jgi:hypothetical protein